MTKALISIRLDQDVLDWFRSVAPRGYQTRINRVLRAYKDRHQRETARAVGRAQQIFHEYHARCFWHCRRDLTITAELIPLVQDGLRRYGGREGWLLAQDISVADS